MIARAILIDVLAVGRVVGHATRATDTRARRESLPNEPAGVVPIARVRACLTSIDFQRSACEIRPGAATGDGHCCGGSLIVRPLS